MAVDYFLKIDGIDGEATNKGFEKWIALQSWGYGVNNGTNAQRATGAGLSTGKASFNDVHIIKNVDKSSPKLFQACGAGAHIKTGKLVAQRTGNAGISGDTPSLTYLTIDLTDIFITSVNQSGSQGDEKPTESVGIAFSGATLTYTEQSNQGTAGASNKGGWNVVTNVAQGS